MKYLLSFLLVIFLGLPAVFGEQTGFQMYSSEGNQYYSGFIKVGQEIHLENGIYNDESLTSIGNIEFSILDTRDHKDILKTYDFSIKSGESEKFIAVYTPTKTGKLNINLDVNYLIPQGSTSTSGIGLIVVDNFSKTFAKNYTCKEGFEEMIKPNYSSVVCISKESSGKLAERWNSFR